MFRRNSTMFRALFTFSKMNESDSIPYLGVVSLTLLLSKHHDHFTELTRKVSMAPSILTLTLRPVNIHLANPPLLHLLRLFFSASRTAFQMASSRSVSTMITPDVIAQFPEKLRFNIDTIDLIESKSFRYCPEMIT